MTDKDENAQADVNQLALELLEKHGWTLHRAVEVAQGQTSEADMVARVRLDGLVRTFGNPDKCWEQYSVAWSEDPAQFYHSEDGMTAQAFAAKYPDLTLVFVESDELEPALVETSRRSPTYNGGRPDKTKRMLAFLGDGGALSPPFVQLAGDGQWKMKGGNHRFNLYLHQSGGRLPLLVETAQLVALRRDVMVLEERPGGVKPE